MNHYEFHIKKTNTLIGFDLKGIWQYRDLLLLLVRRDFLSKYKQTILGPAWFVLQPLATTLIFTVVFNRVANISTDGLPPTLFYLTGLLVWNYFTTSFTAISGSLRANAGVFQKVYFPRLIPPLSLTLSSAISVVIQLVTWAVVYLVVKSNHPNPDSFGLTPYSPLLVLLLIQTAMIAFGFGLLMASLTAKYRDLSFTMSFLTQAWLYLTPVIYPISKIPEKWQWVASLNPMVAVVEATRHIMLGESALSLSMVLISISITLLMLIIGLVFFNRIQRTFVDIL